MRTIVFDLDQQELAQFEGALPVSLGSVIELGNPNRDAIVREVRVRMHGDPTILVYVQVLDRTIPPPLR